MKTINVLAAALLLMLIGCSQPNARVTTRFNRDAEVSGEMPYNPLQWEVIASTLNHNDHTLATVLGNDRAIAYARKNASHEYPAGSVLSVITWSQEEDPRWFGGNIPGKVSSVEFLEVQSSQDHGTYLYTLYGGSPLRKLVSTEEKSPTGRVAYILRQRAAVMP
ncbi:MAG TPA: cytochrome P460 family protein [Terriglobales bacterium]|nr:cytochrome P460 family protein [Terriglobales bacterium]